MIISPKMCLKDLAERMGPMATTKDAAVMRDLLTETPYTHVDDLSEDYWTGLLKRSLRGMSRVVLVACDRVFVEEENTYGMVAKVDREGRVGVEFVDGKEKWYWPHEVEKSNTSFQQEKP